MIKFERISIPYLESVLEELQLAVVSLDVGDAGKVLGGTDASICPQRLQIRYLLREGVRVLSVALLRYKYAIYYSVTPWALV